jgi:ParB family chromosome partitioning protein
MAAAETGGKVEEVPVTQITANPYQPRTLFDPIKMEELVNSIREHGILQPVLVRRSGHEQYQLVAGERRFRAAQAAGLATVPALIKDVAEKEMLEIAVVENLQREDIGPMEAARAYRRLIDEFGMTQEAIGKRVGKHRTAISNTLRLLNLPEVVQDSVEQGEITEGHARALLMAEDADVIQYAWRAVVKKGLSVHETEKLARELKTRAQGATGASGISPSESNGKTEAAGALPDVRMSLVDPHIADVTDRLQQILGTKVTLRRNSGGGGRIEIEFFSAQELERLVETLLSKGA